MRRTPQKDTPPELAIRRELHRRGYRYRVDHRLPGVTRARPDVAFTRQGVAVFIDGCFWHRCPDHGSSPSANESWWLAKLDTNVTRDRRHDMELTEAGWTVVRVWEHEDPSTAVDRIAAAIATPIGT